MMQNYYKKKAEAAETAETKTNKILAKGLEA
jgi:hypothetical protein